MLKLTAPQVKKHLITNDRRLEIDEPFLSKCRDAIGKSLEGGKYLQEGTGGRYKEGGYRYPRFEVRTAMVIWNLTQLFAADLGVVRRQPMLFSKNGFQSRPT